MLASARNIAVILAALTSLHECEALLDELGSRAEVKDLLGSYFRRIDTDASNVCAICGPMSAQPIASSIISVKPRTTVSHPPRAVTRCIASSKCAAISATASNLCCIAV